MKLPLLVAVVLLPGCCCLDPFNRSAREASTAAGEALLAPMGVSFVGAFHGLALQCLFQNHYQTTGAWPKSWEETKVWAEKKNGESWEKVWGQFQEVSLQPREDGKLDVRFRLTEAALGDTEKALGWPQPFKGWVHGIEFSIAVDVPDPTATSEHYNLNLQVRSVDPEEPRSP